MPRYANLYERLVANTKLADPDDPDSCWLWTGAISGHYPKVTIRIDGRPTAIWAHRAMLEEHHDIWFPFDEAAHLCYQPSCINPRHLEVQTSAHNLAERRGYAPPLGGKSWIPVLFPRNERVDKLIEAAWAGESGSIHLPHEPCPF